MAGAKGKNKLKTIVIIAGVLIVMSILGNLMNKAESKNPLLMHKLTEKAVMNGTGTARIGTWAYISISRAELDKASLSDFTEFYKSFKDKKYNWVSVICNDGTGLLFPGGGLIGSFGPIDAEGAIIGEKYRWIMYNDKNDIFVDMPVVAINVDYARQGDNFFIRNNTGQNLTKVMISLDVWKDTYTDSTLRCRVDKLAAGESITITEWSKLSGGKTTSGELLPGAGYVIKAFYLSCDEGDFEGGF